jgi:hypothetical protein
MMQMSQLHMDNVRQRDECAAVVAEHTLSLNRMHDELMELKIVSKTKDDETLAEPSMRGSIGVKRVIRISAPVEPSAPSQMDGSGAVSAAAQSDIEVLNTLRRQLDATNAALKSAEEEVLHLKTSVALREEEVHRVTRESESLETGMGGVTDSRLEQIVAADHANKRIIDQLNGQVDFLNEQLARRETELMQISDRVSTFDELQVDHLHVYVVFACCVGSHDH